MIVLASLLLAAQAASDVSIRVEALAGDACRVTIGGQMFDPAAADAKLDEALAALPREAEVHIVADTSVPYRCVGGTIFALQRLGHEKVGFVAESPPAKPAR